MSEPQAWKYECPCGDESETFQNRATAETARRNHHIQCEETPQITGVPYVADGGIGIVRLPYVCRTCGADTDIYGSPERGEHGDLLVGRTHRLCQNYCKECDAERTFVIAFDVAGHELEAPSYPRMPALEEEAAVVTDGGRRHLSFGGEGESIIDVMERAEIEAHDRGQHDGEHDTCPVCNGEVDRGDGVETDGGLGVSDAGPDQNPPADGIVPCADCEGRALPDCPRCNGTGVDPRRQVRADGGTRGDDTRHLQLDDRLLDAQNEDDDAFVRVVTPRPDTRADQHVVYETDDGTEQTVYDYHRGEVPASDSVVDVVYEESLEAAFGDADAMPRADILDFLRTYTIDSFVANGSKVTVYSFPRSRLERVGEACAECQADAADFMSGGGDEAGGDGGGRR
jgi:hypothetical protein